MLPPPVFTFSIPSIHDDCVLDCRIYHPLRLEAASISQVSLPWQKKAAIVAHPYAPLGGCYDDPVVDVIATTILKEGFVVGTFNFRGAGSSRGRTSWTSKPEQSDYISMIGFMIYYMHHLAPPALHSLPLDYVQNLEDNGCMSIPTQALPHKRAVTPSRKRTRSRSLTRQQLATNNETPITLLLAGYSYGGLITSCIPPVSQASILPLFSSPMLGTPHAEIRLRARSLAIQQNDLLQTQFLAILSETPPSPSQNRGRSLYIKENIGSSPKANRGVRMGGEEDLRRASHESFRSRSSFTLETPERVRKSVDKMKSMARSHNFPPRRQNSCGSNTSSRSKAMESDSSLDIVKVEDKKPTDPDQMKEEPGIGNHLSTAYLLVSPPQGIVGSLATMWSIRSKPAKGKEKEFITEDEMKLVNNPTLTIFCHDDSLISVKKLKLWAAKLASVEGAKLECKEVTGGGHFWHDHDAIRTLRQEVREFVGKL